MKSVDSVDVDSLRWLRADQQKHEFDLAAGDDVVATIRWKTSLGSLATAASAQGEWTLKRTGFLNPAITVRDGKSGQELGRLLAHGAHGTWAPASGERLDWHRTSLLIPGWHFKDTAGHTVLAIEPVRDKLRLEGALLTIPPESQSRPDLVLLLVIGLYFIALAWLEDQAAATSEDVLNATVG